MKTNSSWMIVAPAMLLSAAGVAVTWQQQRAQTAAEVALAAIRQERAKLDAEIAQASQRITAAENDRAELQSAVEAVRKSTRPAPPAKATPPTPPLPPSRARENEVLAGNSELREAVLAARRNAAVGPYRPLSRSLGLAGPQLERFEDLVAQREDTRAEIRSEMMRAAGREERAAGEEKLRLADELFRLKQADLLGEAGSAQLQHYERTLPVQGPVVRLAGATAMAGIPMTPEQGDQLTAILAGASQTFQRGGQANYTQVDWAAVDQEARKILTPEQFAIFSTHEPIGGGTSRFGSRLGSEMDRARKKDAANRPSTRN